MHPLYRDAHEIDKYVAASLALFYNKRDMPGDSYRITVNFSHKHKQQSFETIQTALTRLLTEFGILHSFIAFEVSPSGRLHCHGMANIPATTNIEALQQALQQRFGSGTDAKSIKRYRNTIVDIDRVLYAPKERKSPEQWAAYSIGDAELTKHHMGWKKAHYMTAGLKPHAKAMYEWLRNPDIDNLPFELVDVPPTQKTDWLAETEPTATPHPPLNVVSGGRFARLVESTPAPSETSEEIDCALTVADLADAWNESTAHWIDRTFETHLKRPDKLNTVP